MQLEFVRTNERTNETRRPNVKANSPKFKPLSHEVIVKAVWFGQTIPTTFKQDFMVIHLSVFFSLWAPQGKSHILHDSLSTYPCATCVSRAHRALKFWPGPSLYILFACDHSNSPLSLTHTHTHTLCLSVSLSLYLFQSLWIPFDYFLLIFL